MEQSEPREPRSRVIVVGQVSHQQPGSDAVTTPLSYLRTLGSSEQPVRRRYDVGEQWAPLYHGWLDRCSALVIHNHEGENPQRIPTEEQRAATAAKVVEVRFDGMFDAALLLLPGESLGPICPAKLATINIRCRSGSARITVDIVPE